MRLLYLLYIFIRFKIFFLICGARPIGACNHGIFTQFTIFGNLFLNISLPDWASECGSMCQSSTLTETVKL